MGPSVRWLRHKPQLKLLEVVTPGCDSVEPSIYDDRLARHIAGGIASQECYD